MHYTDPMQARSQRYVRDFDQLLLDHKLKRYLLSGHRSTFRFVSVAFRSTARLPLDQPKVVHLDPFATVGARTNDLDHDIDHFEIKNIEKGDLVFDAGKQAHAFYQVVLLHL